MSNQGDIANLRVALVHDELTRRGGAEEVLEELVRIFPQADVYALYAGEPRMIVNDRGYRIHTSFLQRFPLWFRRHPSRMLPLLSMAAEQFDLSSYDVVISSASGFAKAVVTRVNVAHISYTHTPTRYLWDAAHDVLGNSWWRRWPARIVLHYLRLADYAAAQRVDVFLANSQYTKHRIERYYRRDSTVVYPPIDTSFFVPSRERDERDDKPFVCVGRLTRTKHFDQAINVCRKLSLPLVVIGRGYEYGRLRRLAGGSVRVVGGVSGEELRDHLRSARALIQPGTEDFGMATAEALSCGVPVIALGQGGAREIIEHGVSGIMYTEAGEEPLAEAIRQFLEIERRFSRETMQRSVLRYSRSRFREQVVQAVFGALANRDDSQEST